MPESGIATDALVPTMPFLKPFHCDIAVCPLDIHDAAEGYFDSLMDDDAL